MTNRHVTPDFDPDDMRAYPARTGWPLKSESRNHKLLNPADRECSPCAPDCPACQAEDAVARGTVPGEPEPPYSRCPCCAGSGKVRPVTPEDGMVDV